MKKIIALVAVAAVLLVLLGVGSKKKVAGSWEITVDYDAQLLSNIEMLNDVPLENIPVFYTLTFHDNQTYTFELNEAKMREALPGIRETIGLAITNATQDDGVAMVQKLLDKVGIDLNLQEALGKKDLSLERLMNFLFKLTGYSFDALVERSLDDETLLDTFSSLERTGNYRSFAGMLSFSDSLDEPIAPDQYLTWSVKDNTLTLKPGTVTADALPITFYR